MLEMKVQPTMRRRAAILITVISLAFGLAACGRASEEQINQLLGITPTPTPSAEELAAKTAEAVKLATESAQDATSGGGSSLLAMGDLTLGKQTFQFQCAGCHGPGGMGPDFTKPGSAADVTPEKLRTLIRTGEGHTPPGAYKETEVSDIQINNIGAYIGSISGGS